MTGIVQSTRLPCKSPQVSKMVLKIMVLKHYWKLPVPTLHEFYNCPIKTLALAYVVITTCVKTIQNFKVLTHWQIF